MRDNASQTYKGEGVLFARPCQGIVCKTRPRDCLQNHAKGLFTRPYQGIVCKALARDSLQDPAKGLFAWPAERLFTWPCQGIVYITLSSDYLQNPAKGCVLKGELAIIAWYWREDLHFKRLRVLGLTRSMPRTSILVSGNLATIARDEYTRLWQSYHHRQGRVYSSLAILPPSPGTSILVSGNLATIARDEYTRLSPTAI